MIIQIDGLYYLRNPFDAEPGWAMSSINMDLGKLLARGEIVSAGGNLDE